MKQIPALDFQISSENLRNTKLHTENNAWMSTKGIREYRANCLDEDKKPHVSQFNNSNSENKGSDATTLIFLVILFCPQIPLLFFHILCYIPSVHLPQRVSISSES